MGTNPKAESSSLGFLSEVAIACVTPMETILFCAARTTTPSAIEMR